MALSSRLQAAHRKPSTPSLVYYEQLVLESHGSGTPQRTSSGMQPGIAGHRKICETGMELHDHEPSWPLAYKPSSMRPRSPSLTWVACYTTCSPRLCLQAARNNACSALPLPLKPRAPGQPATTPLISVGIQVAHVTASIRGYNHSTGLNGRGHFRVGKCGFHDKLG
ncbi:hypothetical protein BDN71DRAFT_1436353 [Pleurotus eryngii]|uniref:Uncharacterized protein n=1 Tax=Pleurotus eryngii TaxID=5323 RepID=A0A9P5ZJ20_PLEER|nr:hypothetical protein BDN71DRAFT_1436353 [Pleurotus eryngii]